ncbi:hypothetical protein OKA04_12225 [Luteolibacter flavescens]|uniref:DNA 5'-3' helicase n=1 Tax=Luteolibacter flavescens TaxID=1859460 RepID=A0ABT3FPL0_9BACT|nr:DnaB-like helicase C-terminal domain-containing protein [Luteolibacter flavescens]MCW1885497.1 hypothetical protein [Luteolibacter flavescens]
MSEDPIIRQMPHAIGPEKSVLSSLFKGDRLLDESPRPVHRDLFYHAAHRALFEDFVSVGNSWELVSTVQRLHDKGILDHVGGPAGVTDIYTYAPNGHHFAPHLDILCDRYARRMAIRAATAAAEAAYDCSGEADYLAALSAPVTAVFDAAADAAPTKGMKTLAADFLARFEQKVAGEMIADGIMTGIPEVDRHLHGMKPQHVGIISGRSSGGKSTLATQIFGGLTDALYLILERTEQSAFDRSVVQVARIHHGAVFDPKQFAEMSGRSRPEKRHLIAIQKAVNQLSTSNLHIVKPSNRRLATICAEIRRHVRLNKVKVVFLDQIGLVRGERVKGDTGEAELRGISNTLQELTHELAISLVVLSQVTADGETKNARAVEEDADWWLSIIQERDKKKANFGEHQHILIAKDSHHSSGGERLPLILDKDTLRFVHGFPASADEPKEAEKKDRFGNSRR